ncbi:MAG: FAD:protein FMN transferase [Burkholderiales bacterium]|nr:FAD:protein FMN transferase [Burkholderiales bacterium]
MPRVLIPQRMEHFAPATGARVHRLEGLTMGTSWRVDAVGAVGAPIVSWRQIIEKELDRIIVQMSNWLPDSDISRFNAAAANSWHTLPAEFCEVLDCALRVAEASNGAFDPTVGKLVEQWGFGPGMRYGSAGFAPPAEQIIAQARASAGWRRLRYDAASRRLMQPGGASLDFSGIAKGYAVDRVTLALRGTGVTHCLVEIGGELRGHGVKPDGQPWWVALESPAPETGHELPSTRIALHGLSVATSGDYRRYFMTASGLRQPHTLDPRTGEPVRNMLASVSVLHEQCLWADAWATALTVLGPVQGLALARRQNLAALFILRREDGGFTEHVSPTLQDMML